MCLGASDVSCVSLYFLFEFYIIFGIVTISFFLLEFPFGVHMHWIWWVCDSDLHVSMRIVKFCGKF